MNLECTMLLFMLSKVSGFPVKVQRTDALAGQYGGLPLRPSTGRRCWLHRNRMDRKRNGRELLPDHQWVFINPKSHGRRAERFAKSLYKAREAARLRKLSSHTLRHYFISHCVMSGIEFFTISKWVGHANTRMIEEVYGHLNPEYRRKQMAMLRVV